jgi:glycosyltransferase involved in cell wall biosynthesis
LIGDFDLAMNIPRVSVCVPTYNGEAYLKECLESIRVQTLGDLEVVIVDDESSDGTLAIAKEFARIDNRFRVHPNLKRLGLVGNWNRSLELARGEWIKFVFQDDTIERNCLERLVESCERFKRPFGFCHRHILFDEHTPSAARGFFHDHQKALEESYGTKDSYMDGKTFARMMVHRLDWNPIGEPTVTLFNRSLINDFGMFVPTLIQRCDAEYWLRLATNVGVVHVAERLASFRVHGKSTTSQNQSKRDYRARLVDPLVMHYLMLHEKYYQALRQELYRSSGRLVNWWRLIWAAHHARTATIASPGNLEIKAEWDNIVKVYPKLKSLAWAGIFLTKIRSGLGVLGLDRSLKKIPQRD